MDRIPLITSKEGLDTDAAEVFDWIVESRGKMIRPYEVFLHSPEMARRAAQLGHVVRFESTLSDTDRETLIIATGRIVDCEFEWYSHEPIARKVGVREEVLSHLAGGDDTLDEWETTLVESVREISATGKLSDELYSAIHERLGDRGIVEVTILVGYYTMLSYVMNVAGADKP